MGAHNEDKIFKSDENNGDFDCSQGNDFSTN